jgi:hypothetical protein
MTYQLPPDLDQRNSDLEAIRLGIEDEQAGRMRPLADFDRDMRQKYGMSPRE